MIYVAHATGIIYVEKDNTTSDCRAEFKLGGDKKYKKVTATKENTTLPIWNQRLEMAIDFPTADQVPELKVDLFDANSVMADKLLGETSLNIKVLFDPKENR